METIACAQFFAEYDQLESIREFVEKHAVNLGFSSDDCYDLVFSATEIATNVIKHGYKEEEGKIEVELCRQGQDFVIKMRDDAPIYNPNTIPSPDLSLPLNKMPLGGLGLYITKNMLDSLSHQPTEEGGNEITMIKYDVIKT